MSIAPSRVIAAVVLVLAAGRSALADYETQHWMRPAERCQAIGFDSPDCQKLFWDIPEITALGQVHAAAPDSLTGYPNGPIDRPLPMFVDDRDGHGYESELAPDGFQRRRLCPADSVPWWAPVDDDHDGRIDTDASGNSLYRSACRRGTRAYFGPKQLSSAPSVFDELDYAVLKFQNSARLDHDGPGGIALGPADRREYNDASEIYIHEGAHHAFCEISADRCNDANDPVYANSGACKSYRDLANGVYYPDTNQWYCSADKPDPSCGSLNQRFQSHRTTTTRRGRFLMELPPGHAFKVVENPMWLCEEHLVNDEPAIDTPAPRNFRSQGGAVGEMVIQFFTQPISTPDLKPVNLAFDDLVDTSTTLVPPFTVGVEQSIWYAPFDLAIGMLTLHSHQNMVKGTIQILPATAPRMSATRPGCGGLKNGLPNPAVYENYRYLEPEFCEYWREADGPIILRKGDAVRAQCVVNNGMTATDRIDDPALRRAVEQSTIGEEFLYGQQPPSAYRVRYGCEQRTGVPPGQPLMHARDCPANPAVDDQGRPVDGAYDPLATYRYDYCPQRLGYTGQCVPANVVFANTGKDAMCIPIVMYWPLDRIVNADGGVNQDAAGKLEQGKVDEVGTPGRLFKSPSDFGTCDDGASDGGVSVQDPNPSRSGGSSCRAGL